MLMQALSFRVILLWQAAAGEGAGPRPSDRAHAPHAGPAAAAAPPGLRDSSHRVRTSLRTSFIFAAGTFLGLGLRLYISTLQCCRTLLGSCALPPLTSAQWLGQHSMFPRRDNGQGLGFDGVARGCTQDENQCRGIGATRRQPQ